MAKGQKRGNREVRKPKSESPKAPLAMSAASGVAQAFAVDTAKKKKK